MIKKRPSPFFKLVAKFTHLHVHTEYSLLDGLSKIPKLVSKAKELGMEALAITDHGGMYGAIEFYKECLANEIKPIIGAEVYFTDGQMADKEGRNRGLYHLTLLSKDIEGYKNLMRLISLSQLEGFYFKPRLDRAALEKYSEGLICLSGCQSGPVAKEIERNEMENARKAAKGFQTIFGSDNFYLELQRHEYEKFLGAQEEGSETYSSLRAQAQSAEKIEKGLLKIAEELNIPIVATNDVHYVEEDDAFAQDVLLCIQTGKTIADTKRMKMIDSPTFYLKGAKEMNELFSDLPQSIANTQKIAGMCNLELPLGKAEFPEFDTPNNANPYEYLEKLCWEGIASKVPKVTKEMKERLRYELSVIKKKSYASYFLVVADLANWAKEQGIILTTRGSAAGSLLAFALGITTVNPLEFKLPFERFLNPWRPSLPDIDLDFADDRRDEVIEYVKGKYGKDRVAQIGTFGTMMARAAVRDVARAMSWPYTKADRIAKLIPFGSQGFPMTIEQAKKLSPELGDLYRRDEDTRELLDLAQKLEGNTRHASVHAAGVVIGPKALTEYTPLQKDPQGEKEVTQYDMHSVEEVGLVKIDFLGIRNLSILQKAVQIVEDTRGEEIDLEKIPENDQKAFKILTQGETMGLFQLGGSGMTRYLKDLKPTSIFDIMAMIALFRPGPMASIPEFITRKHDHTKISYFDPRMRDALKESYGLIVYQDDVLLTAINIAGYDWEEADKFRKAIGKKIPAEMAKQEDKFVEGCIENGLSRKKAEELFKLIEPFSAYGFNKAHAASYAVVAYQTAYMKANYPVEFMTAVMTAEAQDPVKISSAVSECQKLKIAVLPPDINASKQGFSIENQNGEEAIRFGLSAIKNVGQAAIQAILEVRKSGQFGSLSDFCSRISLRAVNKKTIESLIKAGAMDQFGERGSLLSNLERVREDASKIDKKVEGQESLFSDLDGFNGVKNLDNHENAIPVVLVTKEEQLLWEKQLLGFYLTDHPLKKILPKLESLVSAKIGDIFELTESSGKKILIGGIVANVKKTYTKVSNSEMAFVRIEDDTGALEIVVFPKVYERLRSTFLTDQIILVLGRLDFREDRAYLLAEDAEEIDNLQRLSKETIKLAQEPSLEQIIQIALPEETEEDLVDKIYKVLLSHPGEQKANIILMAENGATKILPLSVKTKLNEELADEISSLGCRIITS